MDLSGLDNPPEPASAVDALFGWIPKGRQWAPSLRYLLRRARVLEALRSVSGSNLLEVGCGGGTLLIELSKRGFTCTGLETSAEAISLARDLVEDSGSRVRLVGAPSVSWDENFDVVGAFDVLEHIDDDAAAVGQWVSWMKPGGKLVVTVPAHPGRWGPGDVWAGHYRRYARTQLVNLIQAHGLEVDHVECYGFPLANLSEFFGAWYYRRELDHRSMTNGSTRQRANDRSGIDRKAYQRAFPALNSLLGRALLWGALNLQAITVRTNWGSGYLLVARKR